MTNKEIFKIANVVLSQVNAARQTCILSRCRDIGSLVSRLPGIVRYSKLAMEAGNRGNPQLFGNINRLFMQRLEDFNQAAGFYREGELRMKESQPPSYKDIVEDIRHLCDEFDVVEYKHRFRTLSVTTEQIVLDGINFGEFRIGLFLENIGEMQFHKTFEVVALEPNPAACNHEVTHPHVQNERMCCGDGTVPMSQALKDGRLLDFFMIAAQVLRTYNPSSPYVSTENWDGIECYNCGDIVSGDYIYYCDCCGNDFCDDCTSYCECCETSVCCGCMETCECCGKRVCRNCSRECDCGKRICDQCYEYKECDCHEEENNEDTEETQTPVQPVCVGEAHVHA